MNRFTFLSTAVLALATAGAAQAADPRPPSPISRPA